MRKSENLSIKNINKNNIFFRFIALLIGNIFIFSNIQPIIYARSLKPYYVYNSSPSCFGGNWDFESNDDGKNTITLVKCCNDKEAELKSPILSYDVTRVADNFSLVKKITDYNILNKIKYSLGCIFPVVGWFKYSEAKKDGKLDTVYYNIYSNITTIDLPKCKSIGDSAFKGNRNLVNINLPECTSVGKLAFAENENLTRIDLPKCTDIKESTFKENKNLISATFPECISVDKLAFEKNENLVEIYLPKCDSIGVSAFKKNSNLTNIKVSKNYKTVESKTFKYCKNLSNVPNEEFLEKLGRESFKCTGLKKINLKSCKNIDYACFGACDNLTNVNLPECTHVGEFCFNWCEKLVEISLPKCISLGKYAFNRCSSLTKLNLPNVKEIKTGTFLNCSKLESIYLPKCKKISVETFADDMWAKPGCKEKSCKSLKKIVVPKDCIIEDGALPADKMECIERI